jgi:phosphoglycerate dehydrogenase-like enzyme
VTIRARVVVLGATADAPPPGIGTIEDAVDLVFADSVPDLARSLPGADVLFAWRPKGDLLAGAWDHATDLKWIQTASAGVDRLLFPELARSHVVVTNARGVFDEAIAEYVLGLLLVFSKGLLGVLDAQRRAEWEHRPTERLEGRRVLVAGIGSIGRAIGRSARTFRMEVRGLARTARPREGVFERIYGADELDEAVRWADDVVNVLPSTEETRGLFGTAAFGAMNSWTRFVNVGRGATVDEKALVDALASGRIAAAGLDVFEEEPLPPESPLWAMPNVVVSPHVSGDYVGWQEAAVELFVDNLQRYLLGRPLRNVVDTSRGYVPS